MPKQFAENCTQLINLLNSEKIATIRSVALFYFVQALTQFWFSDYNTISVIVVDAPDVTFSSLNSTENNQVNITCSADGRPGDMNFSSFKHNWNGVFIRNIPGTRVGNTESRLTFDPATYEDSGTYHCTVDNGVTDRSGTLLQNQTSDLYIKCKYILK